MGIFAVKNRFQKPRLGVDICSRQLRVTVLQRQVNQWLVLDGEIFDIDENPLLTWQELKKFCKSYCEITVGIGLGDVLVKSFMLEQMCNDEEIMRYLQQQAQRLLMLQEVDLALDYEVLARVSQQQLSIRMVAARKQLVSQILNYCKQVKLHLRAIDVSVLTLTRNSAYLNTQDVEYYAMVLLEKEYLIYCVLQSNALLFVKQVDYNQNDMQSMSLSQRAHVALTQAQQYYVSAQQLTFPEKIFLFGTCAGELYTSIHEANITNNITIHLIELHQEKIILRAASSFSGKVLALLMSIGLVIS